jgi:hypothetical protein
MNDREVLVTLMGPSNIMSAEIGAQRARIAELEAEVARLRAAMMPLTDDNWALYSFAHQERDIRRIRAALEQSVGVSVGVTDASDKTEG